MAHISFHRHPALTFGVRLCKWSRIALAGAACALVSFSIIAKADDQQPFKCPAPGTIIEYTEGGGRIIFRGQDGMWCTGTSGGKPWRRYALLAGPGSKFIDNHVEQIWPLQIGKEINFTIQGSSDNVAAGIPGEIPWYTYTIRALRKERVTVQAGVFDSWLIEVREESGHGRFIGVSTYWYAPDLGYAVRFSYHIAAGIGKDNAFEAKTISPVATSVATPAPAQSPPAAASSVPSPAPINAPAKPSTVAAPASSGTTAQRLQELRDLLDRKLISPTEYEAKRKAILDAL